MNYTQADIDILLSPEAVRSKSRELFSLTQAGKGNFHLDLDKLPLVADKVIEVTKQYYPDLRIPYHSRWNHFNGGINRSQEFRKNLEGKTPDEIIRASFDLVIISVLLDAGAGPDWSYLDPASNVHYKRSEGLAVASYNMFCQGLFSHDEKNPLQAHGEKLSSLTLKDLENGFQIASDNPMKGLEGRLELLKSLGKHLLEDNKFSGGNRPRPSDIYNHYSGLMTLSARDLLITVLKSFGPIWPGRISLGETSLGDVWHHPLLGSSDQIKSLIPFHKLSQWLTYSLIEPLEENGVYVEDLDRLTGLPEYRNGGLFLDMGVLTLRDSSDATKSHSPDSALIIEWRAATICLLDDLYPLFLSALDLKSGDFPLTKMLEGGTWATGRILASEKRQGGVPPLQIKSDGTVF